MHLVEQERGRNGTTYWIGVVMWISFGIDCRCCRLVDVDEDRKIDDGRREKVVVLQRTYVHPLQGCGTANHVAAAR